MPLDFDFSSQLAIFLNWQTLGFCIGIYLIMYVIRTIVESPGTGNFHQGWLWQTVLLPLGPILIGVALSFFVKDFPWPESLRNSHLALEIYGGACGMGSGWVYARVRDWFGLAADAGHPMAQKVAATMLNRPVSGRPPPGPLGPSVRPPPDPPPTI